MRALLAENNHFVRVIPPGFIQSAGRITQPETECIGLRTRVTRCSLRRVRRLELWRRRQSPYTAIPIYSANAVSGIQCCSSTRPSATSCRHLPCRSRRSRGWHSRSPSKAAFSPFVDVPSLRCMSTAAPSREHLKRRGPGRTRPQRRARRPVGPTDELSRRESRTKEAR